MTRKKSKNTTVYMVVVTVFLLVVNASLGALLTIQSSRALRSLIRTQMLDITNTAAAMLDGDALERLTPADAETEDYKNVMRVLTYFQDNVELNYIYCIRDMGNKTFSFGLDPTVEDPGEFGSPIVYTDALYAASLGTPSVDTKAYEDAWGKFYSAYTPVFNSAGKVAGIVAVDFSAEWYNRQVSSLGYTTVIVMVLSLIFGGLIVLIITHRSRRRLRETYDQLNILAGNVRQLIGEIGDMTHQSDEYASPEPQQAPDEPADDIGTLGDKIIAMQEELRSQIAIVHEQAFIDGLTGVSNKRAYLDTIKYIDSKIKDGVAVFAIAVFDLNGLKTINDNYGHECGDLALMDAAKDLMQVFGKENVYRVGGDEFIAIIRTSSAEEMEALFAQLDEVFAADNRQSKPYHVALGVSKGFAVYNADTDQEYKEVFKRADLKMYKDKADYYMKHGDRRRS